MWDTMEKEQWVIRILQKVEEIDGTGTPFDVQIQTFYWLQQNKGESYLFHHQTERNFVLD